MDEQIPEQHLDNENNVNEPQSKDGVPQKTKPSNKEKLIVIAGLISLSVYAFVHFSHSHSDGDQTTSGNVGDSSSDSGQGGIQWKSGITVVNWKGAYLYCQGLAKDEGIDWRLPTARELAIKFPPNYYGPRSDNYVWSSTFIDSGVHYTVNIDNGGKQWRGDDVLAQPLCISGSPWDAHTWEEEAQNAEAMNDMEKALRITNAEAEKGNTDAQHALGNIYIEGQKVPQDFSTAFKWYQKAAEQGHPMSEFDLGTMYENGRGVAQDINIAFQWYQKAAAQGVPEAQQAVARLSGQSQ